MVVNILDFAMVIESVHRRSLWKIFRANGIPSHLVEIIKSFYDNFTCSVGDGDFLFEVDTGVRNGCVMSTLLFNHVVNWIMRRTTEDQFRSVRWTALLSYMEDLDWKLASTLVARGPKLWRWILSTDAQSRLIMKNFLTQTDFIHHQ